MCQEYPKNSSRTGKETTRGPEGLKITRRGLIRLTGLGVLGCAIDSISDGRDSAVPGLPLQFLADEKDIIILPVILSSEKTQELGEHVMTTEKIKRHLGRDGIALCQSTEGAASVQLLEPIKMTLKPEGRHEDSQQMHYTKEQLREVAAIEQSRYITKGFRFATLFVDNNPDDELYIPRTAGLAIQDSKLPLAIIPAWCMGSFLHELGHLTHPKPEHFGKGLSHQPVFSAKRYIDNNPVMQHIEMGSIQELIANDCGFQGDGNPYESRYTIMSRRPSPDEDGIYLPGPLFSPPELAFLNPDLKVLTVPPKPGHYELSYTSGELFGVELELPEDHVLKQIIPDAHTIFFGPVVKGGESDARVSDADYLEGNCWCAPFDSEKYTREIVAFTRSSDGRSTVALCINILPNENGERVLYADEQLDIVAVTNPYAGDDEPNRPTEYVKIIQLSSPEGQQVLAEAKRVAEKRNEVILIGDENN